MPAKSKNENLGRYPFKPRRLAILLILTIGLLITRQISLNLPKIEAAETDLGIASTYNVSDGEAAEGDVVCFSETSGDIKRCSKSNDDKIFGVLISSPQIVLRFQAEEKPIVRIGKVLVNVTNLGGLIKAGDYITSSEIPGQGQKVSEFGYALGVATQNFDEKTAAKANFDGKEYLSGKVEVALAIGPVNVVPKGTIFDKLGLGLLKSLQNPQGTATFVRYLSAALVATLSTLFSFLTFGRNISKGIESIGRNPLAKNQIQFVIAVNTVLIAFISLGGIILSLVIIRL